MQEEQKLQEETIDIKALLLSYTQYWHYFVIAILLFSSFAFLNNRYTVPEYSTSTTLLIRDDNNTQMGAENLLEGLEIFSGKKNLRNEIVILNSYSLSEKIVKELELGISYYQHGLIISNELFKTSPFKVNIDSSHLQLTGVNFYITDSGAGFDKKTSPYITADTTLSNNAVYPGKIEILNGSLTINSTKSAEVLDLGVSNMVLS